MNLYEIVQGLCQEKGITIAALERALDFGNGTIRKWDKTIPSGDRLSKVADYFDVSVDYLLGREPKSIEGELEGVYFSLAKNAQDKRIDPKDFMLLLETIEKFRGERDSKG